MALLTILQHPHERLSTPCEDVELTPGIYKNTFVLPPDLVKKILNMIDTMYAHRGVGLAANQVGYEERVLVMDITSEGKGLRVLINPEIDHAGGEQYVAEGCLSIPGTFVKIARPKSVTVTAIDLGGNKVTYQFKDFEALCFLHEYDHLEGVVMTDHEHRKA